MGGDVLSIIHKISEAPISNFTKDLLFYKLDDVYDSILEMNGSDEISLLEVSHFIKTTSLISEKDRQVLKDMLITETVVSVDLAPVIRELNIEEAPIEKKIKDRVPIFFIFNGGSKILSRMIMTLTRSDFSHVSISLSGLDEIISFATTKQNFGLVVENWFDFCHIRDPKNIGLHFIDVPFDEYEKIKNTIEFHKAHTSEYTYSFKKLFTVPFKPMMDYSKDDSSAYICSEFVYYLISGTSIVDHLPEKERLDLMITPKEFRDKILVKSNIVYEGGIENFNPSSINSVYNLYDPSVLAKKKAIDKRIEKKYEKVPDRGASKLKQLRIKINK